MPQPETQVRIPPLEPPYDPEVKAMLDKWMPPNSGVEPRLREVIIHRTCALTGAEYEWGVHVMGFGRPLGFTDEQLASTVHGSADDRCWSEQEAAVFRLADELHSRSTVCGDLFAALSPGF